jgi:hypothetical protein
LRQPLVSETLDTGQKTVFQIGERNDAVDDECSNILHEVTADDVVDQTLVHSARSRHDRGEDDMPFVAARNVPFRFLVGGPR